MQTQMFFIKFTHNENPACGLWLERMRGKNIYLYTRYKTRIEMFESERKKKYFNDEKTIFLHGNMSRKLKKKEMSMRQMRVMEKIRNFSFEMSHMKLVLKISHLNVA
jgi:CRISPR/Cas system Type II protein with McrA/HNH and RuvC-like nuclease domain